MNPSIYDDQYRHHITARIRALYPVDEPLRLLAQYTQLTADNPAFNADVVQHIQRNGNKVDADFLAYAMYCYEHADELHAILRSCDAYTPSRNSPVIH